MSSTAAVQSDTIVTKTMPTEITEEENEESPSIVALGNTTTLTPSHENETSAM